MLDLGRTLGTELCRRLTDSRTVVLVCAVEDADYLARGVLDELQQKVDVRVFCYWNRRSRTLGRETAPVVSRYEEPCPDSVGTVVVVKSSGTCVARTNLTEALNRLGRQSQVFIATPVMFKDTKRLLESEFPSAIVKRFNYVTCAIDSERDEAHGLFGLGAEDSGCIRPKLIHEREIRFTAVGK